MAAPKKTTDTATDAPESGEAAAPEQQGKVGVKDGYVFKDEMTDAERATYYGGDADGEKADGKAPEGE